MGKSLPVAKRLPATFPSAITHSLESRSQVLFTEG